MKMNQIERDYCVALERVMIIIGAVENAVERNSLRQKMNGGETPTNYGHVGDLNRLTAALAEASTILECAE